MRKSNAFILSIPLILLVAGCSRKPSNEKAQISYSIGAQFGRSLKSQNLDLDPKALSIGMQDGLKGDKLELSDEEMQGALTKLSENRQKAMQEEAEQAKGKAQAFMDQNKQAEGVQTTESGLQYKIIEPGEGASPTDENVVVVHYTGVLADGTEFDSSVKRGQPAEFPVRGVIPGWTEGLKLLKKGGKAKFWIPPELGYGDRRRPNIPANSVLIFDVELLDIKDAPPPPKMPPGHPPVPGKPKHSAKGKK
ncbi:MAG: FKBP-type peptidyl-prolyl cis-trans isomerase [Bdellovibrionales bacterium]